MYAGNRISFLRARWHSEIVDQALEGFKADMRSADFDHALTEHDVPGAFEMPLLARKLAETGQADFVVAAAFVVNGGIYRHEFVAQAVISGLMEAQMQTGVPVLSISLTPHNYQPTQEHRAFFHDHFKVKGAEAASAVRQLSALSPPMRVTRAA